MAEPSDARPKKPLHVYDGDCGFCRRWVSQWQSQTGDQVIYLPYQQVAFKFPQIPESTFREAVHLIEPDGRISRGAEAVLRTLAFAPRKRWMLWAYEHLPGVAPVSEAVYRAVARRRARFSAVTQWIWGDHVGRATYHLTRWIFLRLLGLTYLIAFVSLWTQIHGLIGSRGILPIGELLTAAYRQIGPEAYRLLPTLFWFNAGDPMLDLVCGAGTVLALLLILGIAQCPALVGLWTCYLSLATAGQEFLSFQWDILLLEAGFLAIFFAPLSFRPRLPAHEPPPSAIILWLERWLLFRLILGSGFVKLASNDLAWRNFTALTFHYETQPLPTWLSWYMHQLPARFHVFSCVFMFAIELVVPFLIFAPRRLRAWSCGAMLTLQLLIAATGNYTFFNLLTVALCVLLLDDAMWHRSIRRLLTPAAAPEPSPRPWRWRNWVIGPVAVAILLLSTTPSVLVRTMEGDGPLIQAYRWLAPFRLTNSFGLFAVMTTTRPEIVVEGSHDGHAWLAYEFHYKPGAVTQAPRFVAPHQPRLDWQMWFAALSTYRSERWFLRFCQRLLEDSPEVLGLLKANPFPDRPPRYVRAVLYQYEFTDVKTRVKTGAWWRRERLRLYCPPVSLRSS